MIEKIKLAALGVALLAAVGLAPARADIPAVQHVVIIFQENRSPDNLFHGLKNTLPTADIADSGQTSYGQTVPLTPLSLAGPYDLDHSHKGFEYMWNKGKMNGFDFATCNPAAGATCPALAAYVYANPSDVAPYNFIAVNYGFANRMFQSNQGPSGPAHQFIIGGTSQPTATSIFFASDNTNNQAIPRGATGCDAPLTKRTNLVGPNGMKASTYPCFEHGTLTDLLDNPPVGARQGLTWRYYTPTEGSLWSAPDAIRHMCMPAGSPLKCAGPVFHNGKVSLNPAQVLTDIAQNQLASVSWVMPTAAESDHPLLSDGSGPSWVASVVNAIGASPYWANTVILINWDDWGGFYDHVSPPIDPKYGYYENGFRVPLLVVSAYTPAGYVSQQTHTTGSILKFIETAFGLPVIPPGDFVDARSDDLMDFFNFSQPPRPFITVPAPLGPQFFLHDKRPKLGPDTY